MIPNVWIMLLVDCPIRHPSAAENIERLAEDVVVDKAGVDAEEAHHQDHVSAIENCTKDLWEEMNDHPFSYKTLRLKIKNQKKYQINKILFL